jgi:hypothetical protein
MKKEVVKLYTVKIVIKEKYYKKPELCSGFLFSSEVGRKSSFLV